MCVPLPIESETLDEETRFTIVYQPTYTGPSKKFKHIHVHRKLDTCNFPQNKLDYFHKKTLQSDVLVQQKDLHPEQQIHTLSDCLCSTCISVVLDFSTSLRQTSSHMQRTTGQKVSAFEAAVFFVWSFVPLNISSHQTRCLWCQQFLSLFLRFFELFLSAIWTWEICTHPISIQIDPSTHFVSMAVCVERLTV